MRKPTRAVPPASPFERLERLRVERDWTYRELSGYLGMPLATVASAIRRNRANARTTAKVVRFLAGYQVG